VLSASFLGSCGIAAAGDDFIFFEYGDVGPNENGIAGDMARAGDILMGESPPNWEESKDET
jgi:hypothetical protein